MKISENKNVSKENKTTGRVASGFGISWGSMIGSALLSVCLIVGIGGLVYYINDLNHQSETTIANPDIDPNAKDYTGEGNESAVVEPGKMSISGYSRATIPANAINVPLLLQNPEINTGKVYFSYDLVLDSTGEVLYSSKMVPAGQAITNVTLKRPLPPGVYNATVVWKSYLVDENLKEGNSVNMKLELTAK